MNPCTICNNRDCDGCSFREKEAPAQVADMPPECCLICTRTDCDGCPAQSTALHHTLGTDPYQGGVIVPRDALNRVLRFVREIPMGDVVDDYRAVCRAMEE